jgi:PAS domain S-box-containing protein
MIGRVEAILNNSSDAIVLIRPDGLITQTNPMFDRLFDYPVDEPAHRPLAPLFRPDDRAALSEAVRIVVEERQIQRVELVALRKDHSSFHAEIGLSPIKSSDDYPGGVVCNLRDISERKRAEEQLLKALERERELSELRSRFVSMVSHEFRTPLTSIVSSSELLECYLDHMNVKQKEKHFNRIRDSVRYMTQLLEDVLILGRADTGRQKFSPKPLDLEKLCQDILEEIRLDARPNIHFVYHSTGDCHTVVLDERLLRHILTNLLSNAVKYSPKGGTVGLELHRDDERILISVSDEGIGIPQKDLDRLFEPFHRGDNVGDIKGTGLGLAITQRAVTLHGGTISVESKVGVGTTLTVTMPSTVQTDLSPT